MVLGFRGSGAFSNAKAQNLTLSPKPLGEHDLHEEHVRPANSRRPESQYLLFTILGGSWAGIRWAISHLMWAATIVTLPVNPLITTHEPPSRGLGHQKRAPLKDTISFKVES